MINISKSKMQIPPEFRLAAEDERANARRYYRHLRSGGRSFQFEVYRDRGIRDLLNDLFHFKCAYCESSYRAVHPVAIDHFRPKGMIIDGEIHIRRGYWWLAAEWSNLLPTCIDCNSPRKVINENGILELTGKGNQFPIANRTRRAPHEGDEKHEKSFLLNPSNCRIIPSDHIEFIFKNNYDPFVQPVLKRGRESTIGRESIRVYGLNRRLLVDARRDTAKRIAAQLRSLLRTRTELKKHATRTRKAEFDIEMEELRNLTMAPAQYSAMAKALVRMELRTWKGSTKALQRKLQID